MANSLFLGINASVTIDGTTLSLKDSIAVATKSNINTQNNGYFVFDGSTTQNTSNSQRINGNVRINNVNKIVIIGNLNISGAIDFVSEKIIPNNFMLRALHNLIGSADTNS